MLTRRVPAAVLCLAVVLGCRAAGTTILPSSTVVQAPQTAAAPPVELPNKEGSLKFGVLGDFGTGTRAQYQMADQMAKLHGRFPYEIIVTVGDNLYGSERPQDFVRKFELPYKT